MGSGKPSEVGLVNRGRLMVRDHLTHS